MQLKDILNPQRIQIARCLLLLGVVVLPGCQFGGVSLVRSDFHGVPIPKVSVVPSQSEPEIVDE